ncbi:hypothetical protein H6P81_011763 [Aristolochia fimbriata]|uniref:Uncharacterized protein n=1 Tax=Aristolochia fimbriata TaxID=158543 RepID=A0AAV7E9V4_ARIFI|nr:hypothetical protein H6P81_011763 [Aristolochia fimbriata]
MALRNSRAPLCFYWLTLLLLFSLLLYKLWEAAFASKSPHLRTQSDVRISGVEENDEKRDLETRMRIGRPPPKTEAPQGSGGSEFAMAYVVVVSLPVILFILIVAITCYLLGKAKGRRDTHVYQPYGPPAPPPAPPAQIPQEPQNKSPQV